jgi:hypothetical protein
VAKTSRFIEGSWLPTGWLLPISSFTGKFLGYHWEFCWGFLCLWDFNSLSSSIAVSIIWAKESSSPLAFTMTLMRSSFNPEMKVPYKNSPINFKPPSTYCALSFASSARSLCLASVLRSIATLSYTSLHWLQILPFCSGNCWSPSSCSKYQRFGTVQCLFLM